MPPDDSHSDPQFVAALRRFAAVAAVTTALVGALVLTGWAFDIAPLKSLVPGAASMKPLTALGLVLAGAALWLLRDMPAGRRGQESWRSRLALICAGVVAALGSLILLEYLLGVNLGIDQALFRQAVLAENVVPIGRPAPAAALCLLLLGLALLALDSKPAWLAPAATLVALLVGGLAVIGYAYEETTLYQIGPYVPIALNTALAIVLLALGLLAARPGGPLMRTLTTPLTGGAVGRRLLPAAVLLPFVLGWLRLLGQRRALFDIGFGGALFAAGNIVVFSSLVYWTARLLNQAEARREAIHAALRLNEENLRLLLDSIKDHAIFMLDTEGRVATWNAAAQRIKGYTAAEIIGQPVSVFYPPEAAAAGKPQRVLETAAAAGSAEEEGLRVRKDGSCFWAIADTAALRDERGVLRGYANVTRDITERKQAETALRLSEERFAKAFRASPAALTVTRLADGRFVDVNARFLELLGYERDEVIGQTSGGLGMFPDPADRAEPLRRLPAEGSVRNQALTLLTKSGERRSVLFSTEEIELGGEAHGLAILIDNTDRKRAEEALLQLNTELEQRVQARTADLAASETKFRTLFEVLPVGVSILDDKQRVVDSNPALARIMKMSSQGLASGAYASRNYIYPDGTPMRPPDFPSARALQEQRPVFNVEMCVITETGDTLWIDVSAAPLPVAGFSAVIATADLAERKRIEAALRESEEKFSKAFHASGTGVVIARTGDERIIEVNDSFLRLVGYQREEVLGRTTLEIGVITPADRDRSLVLLGEQGHAREIEIELHTKVGEIRTVLASIQGIMIGAEPCSLSINQDITERKRIEQALAHEHDQLQALMDNVPDTIYFKDRASRFSRINLAQARLLGLATPEMAVGKTDADFQTTPLAAEFYAEEQRLLDSGLPLVDRLEFNPTPAGEPRWLSATKVPVKDASGQVVGLVGISHDITRRVKAEEDLQRLNQQLADRVSELSLLNQLDEQLQTCLTIEETYPLTAQIMRQLSLSQVGALYVVDAARAQVTTAASWGVAAPEQQVFVLDDCWALRLGQPHLVDHSHAGLTCRHLMDLGPSASMCVPLLAQGQALGVLHLRALDETSARTFDESAQQLAHVVADSVALTWANLSLRETLRQQAIRDPLTGLFNRRFMEASLARELNRAARNRQRVGMIMMDIDRFKRINDRFGHEVGDGVLRAIGRLLQMSTRGSDIPCRYGGEEFLLILPEASLEVAGQRAEQIRTSFRQMDFGVDSDQLGPVTLSLGVAAYPEHGEVLEAVLRAADAALYRAKSQGRDRTIVASV